MAHPGEHHPAFEEYCECIFELREDNVEVIQARVADRLHVSRPSVSEMIKRMETEGLIRLHGTRIVLTQDGEKLAESVVRKHRTAERFLTDILGLPWAQAHHEACKWEHVLSPDVEDAITRLLGNPTTCPHGNPIPGSSYMEEPTHPLCDVEVGSAFTVSRIPEELEYAPGMLDFLESVRLTPGITGTVTSRSADGNIAVRLNNQEVDLDAFASRRILVRA
jgi:DtxR family Mn-dependent transcriptional regulator